MVRFSHEEIPSGSDDPSTYSFAKDVVRQARDFACNIYDKYPDFATGDFFGTGLGRQWSNAIWNDICRKAPGQRPPEPEVPYQGGQCQCVLYNITFRVVKSDGSSSGLSGVQRTGEIVGFKSVDTEQGIRQFICISTNCSVNPPARVESVINQAFVADDPRLEVISVVRADGQPDECGNPPIGWLPPFNGTPPAGDLEKPFDPRGRPFTGDGWNLTIPFGIIKADGTVNIDVGGVNVQFDLGGVNINIENLFGGGEPGSIGGEPPDLSGIVNLLNEVKEVAEEAREEAAFAAEEAENARKGVDNAASNDGEHPQNDPNQQNKEQKEEDDPKEEDGVERLLAVEVEILERPSNARVQNGDEAPDVIYAGWFEFKTKGTPHPRSPIHFDRNYFIAPVGADGFAYTVYNGFRARHKVITAKALP